MHCTAHRYVMCNVKCVGVSCVLYSVQVGHVYYTVCMCAGSTVNFSEVQFLLNLHVYTVQRPPFSVHVYSLYCLLCRFVLCSTAAGCLVIFCILYSV